VNDGTITVATAGGTVVTNNGTGSVTLTGTAATIDAALLTTGYTGNSNYYGADSLSVTTTDGGGNTSGTQTVPITLIDTATISQALPPSLSGNENSQISLSGISVSDSPNSGDTLTTVLKVNDGTITVATAGSATVSGNGSASVTLTGTAAAIDAALLTMSYTGNANTYGSDTLSVTTTDGGGKTSGTQTVLITLIDTAMISQALPPSLSGNENSPISLSGVSVSDSPNSGDTLTMVLKVNDGTITVATAGSATVSGNGSGSVTLTGTALAIDAALLTTSYTGNANTYGSDTLSVTTTDGGGKTSGSQTVPITLIDTATISQALPPSLSGNENSQISLSGISVSDSPNSADALTTVLKVNDGTITVATAGSATVSGNGSGSVTLKGTAAAIDAALATTGYTGNTNYYGADSLSVITTDGGGKTSGTQTVPITINQTVAPGVTVTISNTDVNLANRTATVTFTFTTAPTKFTLSNTTAIGGALSKLSGSGTTYTATFTGAANTDINDATVLVKAGSWGSGNSTPPFTVDTVTPTVTVTTSNTDVNVAHNAATISFTFSEAPVSFTLADTTAVGGTLSNLTGSGKAYTATFTANANTSISNANVSVTKNSWLEINGNPGAAGSTPNFTVDTITPTVTVATSSKDVNIAQDTATITFKFSEAPASFTLADTTAVGGTLSNLTSSGTTGTTYTATFTGAAGIDITNAMVSVTAGSWQENNGNLGLGGSTPAFTVDTIAPTVMAVTTSPASGEVNTKSSVAISLSMSESVSETGGPKLLLNDGGTAAYKSGSGTNTLVFNYTVAAGQATSDLRISGILLSSPSAIVDLAGNSAILSGAGADTKLGINSPPGNPAGPSGGSFTVSGTQELELFGASSAAVSLASGSTGVLKLDDSIQFKGTVAGLALGNFLDLADIGFGSNTTLGYVPNNSSTGGTLTATDGTHMANIALLGQYVASSFVASSDGHGGTLITDPPVTQQSLLVHPVA
jgi:hypothetical protein